jgi:hypothetical protein
LESPAQEKLLQLISCKCRKGCRGNCGCSRDSLYCSRLCQNCEGTCDNAEKYDSDEDDDLDDPHDQQPIHPPYSWDTSMYIVHISQCHHKFFYVQASLLFVLFRRPKHFLNVLPTYSYSRWRQVWGSSDRQWWAAQTSKRDVIFSCQASSTKNTC